MNIRCLALLFLVFALPHQAQAEKLTLHYGAYSGGFQALDIVMTFDVHPDRYKVTLHAKPYGVLGYLLPWAGDHETSGVIRKQVWTPLHHREVSHWREDVGTYLFTYKNGVLSRLDKREIDNGRRSAETLHPEAALHRGTVDIITGAMQMLSQVDMRHGCKARPEIFDGKRRFAMRFTAKEIETMKPTRWNKFAGRAHVCEVEMIPLLGYNLKKPKGYYKIQEEARAAGQLPRVWLAQLWPNGPYLPIKMMVKYGYGAMLVHLQKVRR